ncbi:MAG: putative toxin-antitoxin system toxin component, PIN family [Terracidiphilus sp.]|jgi:putative PIN family toxin of toxin-antitoxin system
MRVVLDTNVVVSALLWSGVPRRLLRTLAESDVLLFSSTSLLAELTDVLSRAKFEKRIALLHSTSEEFVDLYAGCVLIVRPISVPRLAPDPDDDLVIGTALAAEAALIVTGDKPLLSVGTCEGGRIVTVREAIEIIALDSFRESN